MSADANPETGDLKSTPYWWEAAPLRERTVEPVPAQSDVAIVGAGYTGLVAALTLARAGRSVVVFDALAPGEGASSRNGGIASASLHRSFGALIDDVGLEGAKAIYTEAAAARAHLHDLVADEKIDCGYARVGRFSGAVRPRDYDRLGREADLLNKHLDYGIEMVARADQHQELATDVYYGGEVRPYIAGLHPAQFHAGLLDRVKGAGVAVIGHTPVTGIVREDQGFTVNTSRGRVRAHNVITATNGYTDAAAPWLRRRVIPLRSRIIATEPLAPGVMDRLMPKRRMLGNTRHLFNYYRPSPDGTRILFGGRGRPGEGHAATDAARLRGEMVNLFPELKDVRLSHSWSGLVALTFDRLPHTGVHDGVHFAAGYCGSGLTWAPWLGRKAALSLLGEDEAPSAFDRYPMPGRPLYSGNPWFMPAVFAWYTMRDRMGI
jgi:glycine/D-amino acid oxidase-like deaminating enzyme